MSNEPRVIDLLKRLVATDSRNPFRAENDAEGNWILAGNESAIADLLEAELKQSGFAVKRQPVHTDSKGIT
ncbi:MAG: hypothetical protein PHQ23_17295, partial [Candidatus Wallbacteria bacterium]|nr:hypothetical protein [Candidatus Wallbacteria bacterium]